MSNLMTETVTQVHHWNDSLFSFRTTRDRGFRFRNGHFTMIGLPPLEKPLLRAYSIASANHEDELEFFSIKVADGRLTSQLQGLQVGDEVLVGKKPTGTLVAENLLPGARAAVTLYLLATGTGLAPFLSIVKDPEIYEQYDRVVLAHGVRYTSELAYADYLRSELPNDKFLGDLLADKLSYYPTVTRETSDQATHATGRLTDLMRSGKLFKDLGLAVPTADNARFMLCGSPSMLKEFGSILDNRGFAETRNGRMGHYVVERAFVES
ncbi:MAG: ferredoxin--NADP reductase [Pseudomonadales bacterium]